MTETLRLGPRLGSNSIGALVCAGGRSTRGRCNVGGEGRLCFKETARDLTHNFWMYTVYSCLWSLLFAPQCQPDMVSLS